MLRVLCVQAEVLIESDSSVLHQAFLALSFSFPIDSVEFILEARELLDLATHIIAPLLQLELFFREKVSLLVDSLLDTLKSDFPTDAERIALEDIFPPLDSITFDVCQELLE